MLKEGKLMQERRIELAIATGTYLVFNSHEATEKPYKTHIRTIFLGQEKEIYPFASISLWSNVVTGQDVNSPVLLGCAHVCQGVLSKDVVP